MYIHTPRNSCGYFRDSRIKQLSAGTVRPKSEPTAMYIPQSLNYPTIQKAKSTSGT